ncbi:MAG: hypothetical protein M1839_004307 [Geoglossum umbratile]|nr:MAG: hypothetical protein M1839_004307 [Geoglossum umbratile]
MARDANNGLTSCISISETPDESPDTLEHPVNAGNWGETLLQKIDNNASSALTKAEFQAMLKDLEALYEEIIELIIKTKDLQAYSENYRKQLQETKQALQKSEAMLNKILEQTPNGSLAPEKSR